MNPARWRQVNELFHAVLEQDSEARERLLERAALDDPELAREVRSLLLTNDRTEHFLDVPAWGVAADLILEDPAPRTLVGQDVGAYRVHEEIGRGGMGIVYAAEDQRLGRPVALKALPPEYTSDPRRRERLTREARAAAALSHPSIATIFALEEIEGNLYIVTELVRGHSLREETAHGPADPDRLLPTLIDIAAGLEAAHARGIVHRDLKPENVVRREDGQIKILDFGLARWESTPDSPSMTRLTEAGAALGTPGYMSPEQLRGESGDARSDLFAFGVVTWELATGEHPFGTDPASVLARMTELMDGRASVLSRALPVAGLDRIARKCMRGSPADRYQSARELLSDLRALAVRRETQPEQIITPNGSSTAMWWWQFHQATIALLDVVTAILSWFVRARLQPSQSGRWVFFAMLALATTAVTLRLNLLFTARVHPSLLSAHRSRLFGWIAGSEAFLALLLLFSAVMLSGTSDEMAAALVSIAIVTIASVVIIEPTTTAAAGIRR